MSWTEMEFSQAFWLGIVTAILHGIGCFVDAMQEMDWDCCSYCTSCFADWFYWRGWNFELLAGAALRVGFLNFFSLRSEWIQYVIVFMTLSMVCVLLQLSSARAALTFILQSRSFSMLFHWYCCILLSCALLCMIGPCICHLTSCTNLHNQLLQNPYFPNMPISLLEHSVGDETQ
jgi:hypothetical protein